MNSDANVLPPLRAAEFAHPRDERGWRLFRGEKLIAQDLTAEEAEHLVRADRAFGPMYAALSWLEWLYHRDSAVARCPCCQRYRTDGHAENCLLANGLRAATSDLEGLVLPAPASEPLCVREDCGWSARDHRDGSCAANCPGFISAEGGR